MKKQNEHNENVSRETNPPLPIGGVSKRRFWKIEYERWTDGFGGGDYTEMAIYWGTWWEAAREVVRSDESVCRPKWRRKVEPFDLPHTNRKRKPFYVC